MTKIQPFGWCWQLEKGAIVFKTVWIETQGIWVQFLAVSQLFCLSWSKSLRFRSSKRLGTTGGRCWNAFENLSLNVSCLFLSVNRWKEISTSHFLSAVLCIQIQAGQGLPLTTCLYCLLCSRAPEATVWGTGMESALMQLLHSVTANTFKRAGYHKKSQMQYYEESDAIFWGGLGNKVIGFHTQQMPALIARDLASTTQLTTAPRGLRVSIRAVGKIRRKKKKEDWF